MNIQKVFDDLMDWVIWVIINNKRLLTYIYQTPISQDLLNEKQVYTESQGALYLSTYHFKSICVIGRRVYELRFDGIDEKFELRDGGVMEMMC